jgi:hypothetical protein
MELAVVRSAPMGPKQFLDTVSALQRGLRSRGFKYYDKKEVFWLYRRNLPSLVAFKPTFPEVEVEHLESGSMQSYDRACVFLETLTSEVEGVTRYGIDLGLLERSSQVCEEDAPNTRIRIDARADGFLLAIILAQSLCQVDLECIKALYERLFREMGLADLARAEIESGRFRLSVAESLTVTCKAPRCYEINGFGSFRDLAERAKALLVSRRDQRVQIGKFLEFRDHATYEHARERLGCYFDWKCAFFGAFQANPVSDPSILERDDYPQIPLFGWSKGETQFQGEAQKTPEGWVLEITSTCPDCEQLLQVVNQYASGWTVV